MPAISKEASHAKALAALVAALRAAQSSDYMPLAFRGSCPWTLYVGEHAVARSMLREWERRSWVTAGKARLETKLERVVTYQVTEWGHAELESYGA